MFSPIRKVAQLSLFAIFASLALTTSVSAETFNVTDETGLQDAINDSVANTEDDTIDLMGRTIVTNSEIVINLQNNDQLVIKNGVLNGVGTEDGIASHRLIKVEDQRGSPATPASITFDNMGFINANFDPSTAPDSIIEGGGAALLLLDVNATITDSRFANNTAIGNLDGGAIDISGGNVLITRSEFSNNSAIGAGQDQEFDARGGAVSTSNANSLRVINSSFSGNSATLGGAISTFNSQQADVISQSSFIDNLASDLGGAIWARSSFNLNTSTFFGNVAEVAGGALYFQDANVNTASPTISNNTFVGNIGRNVGDSIHFFGEVVRPSIFSNIILSSPDSQSPNCSESGNLDGPDFFQADSLNISDDNSCGLNTTVLLSSELSGTQQLFMTAVPIDNSSDNGVKSTPSFALRPDTIAVNSGGEFGGVECNTAQDQRGFERVNACDVGSFELQPIQLDTDDDSIPDDVDNCVFESNPNQTNTDEANDGGDACDTDDDNDGQLDVDEKECGSDPLEASSKAPDIDNDGVPNCVDSDFNPDFDNDGVADDIDNCPFTGNREQINTDGDDNGGDACDLDDDNDGQSDANELLCLSDPLDVNSTAPDRDGDNIPDCNDDDFVEEGAFRAELFQIGDGLEAIRAGTSGNTNRILRRSIVRLRFALQDSNWINDSTLTDNRGTIMYNRMGRALSDIEIVLNDSSIDPALREQLAEVGQTILENLRQLAVNELDVAINANGRRGAIRRAQSELVKADNNRSVGALQAAAHDYRDTWRISNRSF